MADKAEPFDGPALLREIADSIECGRIQLPPENAGKLRTLADELAERDQLREAAQAALPILVAIDGECYVDVTTHKNAIALLRAVLKPEAAAGGER